MNQSPNAESSKKFVRVALALILREPPRVGEPAPQRPHDKAHDPLVEVLITQRLDDAVYGGWWEFPGGKIEAGEGPETAATREALEELGIHFQHSQRLDPLHHEYGHARVELHPVLGTMTEESNQIQNIAVADHRWVSMVELAAEARFLPGNLELVQRLLALDRIGGLVRAAQARRS